MTKILKLFHTIRATAGTARNSRSRFCGGFWSLGGSFRGSFRNFLSNFHQLYCCRFAPTSKHSNNFSSFAFLKSSRERKLIIFSFFNLSLFGNRKSRNSKLFNFSF